MATEAEIMHTIQTHAEHEATRTLGPSGRTLDLTGHVGFDSLPDQLVNKSVRKGFAFNMLCIGETGIGKSTLMESLFRRKLQGKNCSFIHWTSFW